LTADYILFDLDGTLSDPTLGFCRSINYALEHFGYPTRTPEELTRYIGPPLDESLRALTGSTSEAHIDELVKRYRERYADVGYAENLLYPGIPEALRRLDDAGLALGLCTSKRVDFAEQILTLFGLREHFRVVSGGDVGIPKHVQLRSLMVAGTVGGASVMVGDRAVDIHAARENRLRGIGVLWGHGSRDELTAAGPHVLLEAPAELASLADIDDSIRFSR
jgi:phosphoglycolate phosphatase